MLCTCSEVEEAVQELHPLLHVLEHFDVNDYVEFFVETEIAHIARDDLCTCGGVKTQVAYATSGEQALTTVMTVYD